ncbi:hypothetical protein E2562_005374 [Oryza meyeriana var. granulata]|uniref:Uncharacterized protein n=1 Tax=Oryza meyeriana var. granulata TaxID=110450 RepID=A0A6G1DFN1_9ORYZ|nr:hypothetical protein E2562_005374 [Oryza meyeriana var. granulata]
MDSKQQLAVRPVSAKKHAGIDGKAASRERSGLANASFRVYYSLRAGAVPFLWESSPGTPKTGAAAAAVAAVSPASEASTAASAPLPPISPPPSYQSVQMKGRRCRPRSSWPAAAGDIVRALLGMLGLGKRRRRPSASISELPPFASLPY